MLPWYIEFTGAVRTTTDNEVPLLGLNALRHRFLTSRSYTGLATIGERLSHYFLLAVSHLVFDLKR